MTETARYVRSAGILVCVRFDQEGRPFYATPVDRIRPDDPEHERLVALAVTQAFDAAVRAAITRKLDRDRTAAWEKSAADRAKASAEHWANYWLSLAHAAYPDCGRDKLSREARRLAAKGIIDADGNKRVVQSDKERNEISPYRAQQYLDRLRNPPG